MVVFQEHVSQPTHETRIVSVLRVCAEKFAPWHFYDLCVSACVRACVRARAQTSARQALLSADPMTISKQSKSMKVAQNTRELNLA